MIYGIKVSASNVDKVRQNISSLYVVQIAIKLQQTQNLNKINEINYLVLYKNVTRVCVCIFKRKTIYTIFRNYFWIIYSCILFSDTIFWWKQN